MTIAIRPAEPKDAALILRFIRELAEYERALEQVRASEADLINLLFGPSPKACCEIAESRG